MISRFATLTLILGLFFCSAGNAYAATQDVIPLTLFRVVRVSASSMTLSFTSDAATIAAVEYANVDGAEITLTDSVPQQNHLFTITELDPTHGYTFTVTAGKGKDTSFRYVILLAPGSIGPTGQSLVPPINVLDDKGATISSSPGASTTPYQSTTPSPWYFVVAAFGMLGASVVRRNYRQRIENDTTHL